MKTRLCPECGTLIRDEDINEAQGTAVCGECSTSFYYREFEEDTSYPPPPLKEIPGMAPMRAFTLRPSLFLSLFLVIFGSIFLTLGTVSSLVKWSPISLPFMLIGFITILIGLYLFLSKTVLVFGNGKIILSKGMGPWRRNRQFDYDSNSSIRRAKTNVTVNNVPMTKIVIKTGTDTLELGTMFNEKVITFLLYALKMDQAGLQ